MNSSDQEMKLLASEEVASINRKSNALEENLEKLYLPKSSEDSCSAVLEVRAGTGGLEAALFTNEMWQLYEKYSSLKGWSFEAISTIFDSCDPNGGLREGIAIISGDGAYGWLKYEGGVHRVQRIPSTDTSGRMHTSTMTVAVLPKPSPVIGRFVHHIYCGACPLLFVIRETQKFVFMKKI